MENKTVFPSTPKGRNRSSRRYTSGMTIRAKPNARTSTATDDELWALLAKPPSRGARDIAKAFLATPPDPQAEPPKRKPRARKQKAR